jgi:hypothetical protein
VDEYYETDDEGGELGDEQIIDGEIVEETGLVPSTISQVSPPSPRLDLKPFLLIGAMLGVAYLLLHKRASHD